MDYNELSILIKRNGFTLERLCKTIGITTNGFRKGYETGSLGVRFVQAACKVLDVSPNEFIGWNEKPNSYGGNFASNISGGNTQNSNEAILALREELKEQRNIIKEKDKQINRLLVIIEKGKKK